jgi:hypothetical protein
VLVGSKLEINDGPRSGTNLEGLRATAAVMKKMIDAATRSRNSLRCILMESWSIVDIPGLRRRRTPRPSKSHDCCVELTIAKHTLPRLYIF